MIFLYPSTIKVYLLSFTNFLDIYYSLIPAYENLVHLKVSAPKLSDLVDILIYSDHEKFYTLRFLLDSEYGLLDLGSNIHFLL